MNDRQQQLLSMLMGNEAGAMNENQQRFFFTLVGMVQWALEHPSTSRFEYISPERVKAHKHLKGAFMNWWYAEHPNMADAQRPVGGLALCVEDPGVCLDP